MKVCAKVEVVEIDGEATPHDGPEIEIIRHRIYGDERVDLKFPGCEKVYTFMADELIAAIRGCKMKVEH